MKKHLNIKISGRVQGVFFRASAQKEANKLDITGFAKNEKDGTVYIEAEGEQKDLDTFLEWCKNGPGAATVTKIETSENSLKHFPEFGRDFEDY